MIYDKLLLGAMLATVLGGGGLIINNKIDNVRQDAEHEVFSSVMEEIGELDEQLEEANKNLAILNERMKQVLDE